ncbi:hypothetical protein B0H66DRAFT_627940, partial [Apodospora peruviana]
VDLQLPLGLGSRRPWWPAESNLPKFPQRRRFQFGSGRFRGLSGVSLGSLGAPLRAWMADGVDHLLEMSRSKAGLVSLWRRFKRKPPTNKMWILNATRRKWGGGVETGRTRPTHVRDSQCKQSRWNSRLEAWCVSNFERGKLWTDSNTNIEADGLKIIDFRLHTSRPTDAYAVEVLTPLWCKKGVLLDLMSVMLMMLVEARDLGSWVVARTHGTVRKRHSQVECVGLERLGKNYRHQTKKTEDLESLGKPRSSFHK